MILRDFACTAGHRFEAGVDAEAADPPCPACGAATRRLYTAVRIGGAASTGVPREQMPHSWQSVGRGNPDAIRHFRKQAEFREKIEQRDPELAGDRRPVLAHEGIFAGRPLRAGDDISASVGQAMQKQQQKQPAAGRGASPRKESDD